MSRAALMYERKGDGWRPVGVLLGTKDRLDSRHLPGSAARDAYFRNILTNAQPPFLDGTGEKLERGTWEDWIAWAVDRYGNGHDTWVTEVEPDATVESTYGRYVLGSDAPLTRGDLQPQDDVPELSGYRKVRRT